MTQDSPKTIVLVDERDKQLSDIVICFEDGGGCQEEEYAWDQGQSFDIDLLTTPLSYNVACQSWGKT